MDDSDLSGRRRLPAIVLAATVLVVGAAAVLALRSGGSPSTKPAPARTYAYACLCSDEQVCSRQATDYGLRRQLTTAQQDQAEAAANNVDRALASAAVSAPETCVPDGGSCSIPGNAPSTDADVQQLRAALVRAGITGAVVKIAGRDDLEPAGTIEYAVPAGPGCDIGFQYGLRGGGGHTISGRYPDGSCLHQK